MNIVAMVFIGVGALLSALNWLCLSSSLVGRRYVSAVFPAPSLITTIGLALLDSTRPYWWAGLLTDYTLFTFLAGSPWLIAEVWRTSFFTRQELFVARDGRRHFTLSLHRGGHFLLKAAFDPGVPCNEYGAFINSFGLIGRWEKTSDGCVRLWSYCEDRELTFSNRTDCAACETNYPPGKRFAYDRLDGLQFRRNA